MKIFFLRVARIATRITGLTFARVLIRVSLPALDKDAPMPILREAFLDFINGIYQVGGNDYLFSNLIQNPTVIDAGGLITNWNNGMGGQSTPDTTGPLNAKAFELTGGIGMTMVMSCTITLASGGCFPWFQLDNTSFNTLDFTFRHNLGTVASPITSFDVSAFVGVNTQVAFVYDPINGIFATSVNGSAVLQASGSPGVISDPSQPVQLSHGTNTNTPDARIQFLALYDPVPLVLLPTLSTFGSVPPPIIGATGTQKVPTDQLMNVPHNLGLWR